MLKTRNRKKFAKEVADFKPCLIDDLNMVLKREIRLNFDQTRVDSTAQACIEVAKELGFTELAEEMERDLESELTEVE